MVIATSRLRQFLARHERWFAFGRLIWRRFVDDKCFEAAGALSYTTLFALVPLTTVVFAVISAFPDFRQWSDQLTDFIFANFVPETGRAVQAYLREFAGKASALTSAGLIALLVSAVLMITSVEDTFNRIWRAPRRQRRMARLVMYWTVLTLGPMLIIAGLAVSSYLFTLPLVGGAERDYQLTARLLSIAPPVVTFVALGLAYLVVPNSHVRARHAAIGAAFATILFEAAKHGFTTYLAHASFGSIYGPVAVVPVFLLWVYVSWSVVLLGASLAASLAAVNIRARIWQVTAGLEFAVLLRVLRRIIEAARAGAPLRREQLHAVEPEASDAQLDRCLTQLRDARLIQRGELGDWLLARDPERISMAVLFQRGGYRWPDEAELARFAAVCEPEDERLLAWLRAASEDQARHLQQPLTHVLGARSAAGEGQGS